MCLYNLPVFNYILIVCEACVFFPLTPSWACVCRFLRYGCARTASHYSVSVGNIGWAWSDRRALPAALCLQFFFFFFARCSFPPLEPGAWAGLRQQRHSRVRLSRQMHNMQMRHCWWAGLTTERATALTLSSPRSSSVHTRAVYVNKTISCNCSCKRNSCLSYCVHTHTLCLFVTGLASTDEIGKHGILFSFTDVSNLN